MLTFISRARERLRTLGSAGRHLSDAGQSTVEYCLMAVVAGSMAIILLTYIQGGGVVEMLFDGVVKRLMSDLA